MVKMEVFRIVYGPDDHPTNTSSSGFGVPSAVWKVDTGNVDGPTSTSPTEVNRVQLSSNCYDGVVDDDGLGYWAIYNRPLRVAKTRGGEGAAPMVGG